MAQIEFKAKLDKQRRETLKNERAKALLAENQAKKIARNDSVKFYKKYVKNILNNLYSFLMKLQNEKQTIERYPAHNPIVLIDLSQLESAKKNMCTFFAKTGVCKYANTCLNSHTLNVDPQRESLTTLIIPGMYVNMLHGYEVLSLNLESGMCV